MKILYMIYPKIPLAQSVLQICLAKGLTTIVISPGSRNAPLTIGFANHPGFNCYSIADERCAAFFALGIAQQTAKPVALLCTSGSALLNYYPAFAEAFYSEIPLVVISADRPAAKIDIGDGQTIRQRNVFANHSLYNANLLEDASAQNDAEINAAIDEAMSKKGPVHINVPFEEPLYETVAAFSVDALISTNTPQAVQRISQGDVAAAANIWNAASKKLILIGGNNPDAIDPSIVESWAQDPSIVVMTEVTSNVHHASFIANIDTIITPFSDDDFEEFRPELLITIGGMIVSKRVKAWLRSYAPQQHWHIDALRAYDTFGCLTRHFVVQPDDFFKQLLPFAKNAASDFAQKAREIKQLRAAKHDAFVSAAAFSDFKAFAQLIGSLPTGIMLQISNSAAIRYAQLFEIDGSIAVFCNRGTSGIDGSTSTAIGAATASKKPTVLITGDISFFYDSNALWNNYVPDTFKIVVVNNSGGGIFRILPGHSENAVFNTFFETHHNLTAQHLAKMYGFEYFSASGENSLGQNLDMLYNAKNKAILEIFTPEKENDSVLKSYFKSLG